MDILTHEPASPGEGGWHLTPADHALVAAKSRANRLRFAVMLLFTSVTTFTISAGIGLIVVQWLASALGGFITGRLAHQVGRRPHA